MEGGLLFCFLTVFKHHDSAVLFLAIMAAILYTILKVTAG